MTRATGQSGRLSHSPYRAMTVAWLSLTRTVYLVPMLARMVGTS